MNMTLIEIAAKLRMINRLTADEIGGYEAEARKRGLFDGEREALLKRRVAMAKG